MNYALKFPGRTRQKTFLLLFIFTLLLFPPGVQASESLISSVASPNSVGRAALEFENVDSFDVHPANRWSVIESGSTAVVDTGLLDITDTGDGTQDYVQCTRGLRDLAGTVEIRFKFDSDSTGTDQYDGFFIYLWGPSGNTYVYLQTKSARDNEYAAVFITMKSMDGGTEGIELLGDERLFDNFWYIVRIDYDIRQSVMRWRMFFDNGSKVFDYNVYEISDDRAAIFEEASLDLIIHAGVKTNNKEIIHYWDYVNAPFKEREWEHTTIGADTDWLVDETWEMVEVQDDIDEQHIWRLTVPRLDLVSAVFQTMIDASGMGADFDFFSMTFRLYCVDADDGDLHEAFQISLIYNWVTASNHIYVQIDGVVIDSYGEALTQDELWASFSVGTRDDRSIIGVMVKWGWDVTNLTATMKHEYDIAVSEVATNPSQEFVCEWNYRADFEADIEARGWVSNWNVISKDSMMGMDLGDARAAQPDDYYDTSDMGFWGALTSAFSNFVQDLGNFITRGFDAIFGPIIGALQEGLETALDGLGTIFSGIIGVFVDTLEDILDALTLLVATIVGFATAFVFFIWDALNLPNIIEIFDLTVDYIIEFVQWLVVFIQDVIVLAADLSWLILVLWWLWAVPIQWARADFNPLAGIGNFVEVYFYDALPWSILGFHIYIPQGIVFTLWLLLLLPADFAIFGAMGL